MAFKPSAALSLLLLVVVLTTVAAGRRSNSKSKSSEESDSKKSSKRGSKSQEQEWCSSDCQGSLQDLERKIDQLQAGQNNSQSNADLEAQLTAMNSNIQEILTRARCPASFTYDSNSNLCVKLFREHLSWNDAKENCGKLGSGARLVVLDTAEKATFVLSVIEGQGVAYWAWLGGLQQEGQFKWTTGQVVDLVVWIPWQASGDCLIGDSNLGVGAYNCDSERYFFCEVPLL